MTVVVVMRAGTVVLMLAGEDVGGLGFYLRGSYLDR